MARPSEQALVSDQAATRLDPSGFDPSRWTSDKHSPNLRKWLIRHSKRWGTPIVGKDPNGFRWIGWINDHWLRGARLGRVLVEGSRAQIWAWPNPKLSIEVDFWDRYDLIGRCAIDEEHRVSYIGDETRWLVGDGVRHCLWCGKHTQILRRWTETRQRERWEPASAIEAGTAETEGLRAQHESAGPQGDAQSSTPSHQEKGTPAPVIGDIRCGKADHE